MPFTTPLRFEDDDGLPFTLTAPLTYYSDVTPTIVVPTGFKTDLASIPRGLWNILPPVGKYDRAAVLHDFLYQLAPNGCSRSFADGVLKEAMEVAGVGGFARWAIYTGIRAGGWVVWNRYRKAAPHVR